MGPDGRFLIVPQRPKNKKKATIPHGEKAYLSALGNCVPTMFILNADRRLDSDSVANPSDEVELRRVMRFEEPKRINDLVARAREIALSQAIDAATKWIGQKALQGANQGSMNVHSVYVAVLKHLMGPVTPPVDPLTPVDAAGLLKKLTLIEARTAELAKYELATPLATEDFRKTLTARNNRTRNLAVELLKPYISSLEGRLEAVDPIYEIVDRFIRLINGLLNDKAISFKLSNGFNIINKLGQPLAPAQLSSGEQQLLLLFCYVIVGRDKPSVFMIDEPEISLNVKWQRQLIRSLLDLTSKAPIQFIFASHSMELLAQHRNRVVTMVNQR